MSIDLEGTIREASDVAVRHFGRDRADVVGQPLGALVSAGARAQVDALLRALLADRPASIEVTLDRPGASALPVVIERAAPAAHHRCELIVADLSLTGYRRSMTGPSERVATAVANSVPSMVAYWNSDLHCEFANKAYLRWFGRADVEVVQLTLPQLLGPELFRANEPFVRAALRGELQGFERTLTRADGTVGYTWAQYVPDVVGGTVRGFLAIVTDISPVKAAEAALRTSEARFRQILEVSPVPYALNDGRLRITYVNPAFVRAFGYTLEDVPTLADWWLAAYPDPDTRRSVEANWQLRFAGARESGRPMEPTEVRLRCKDGSTKAVIAYGGFLPGPVDDISVNILVDVTQQRRLEQAMLDATNREQREFGIALHEGLSQDLAGLAMLLDGLSRTQVGDRCTVDRREMTSLAETARRCVAISRAVAQGLSPVELGSGGLGPALRRLASSDTAGSGPRVTVVVEGFGTAQIEPGFAESVYRIAQVMWANSVRSPGATRLTLDAQLFGDRLQIIVRDDGARPAAPDPGEVAALEVARYRARALGGTFDVERGHGGISTARLTCMLPSR